MMKKRVLILVVGSLVLTILVGCASLDSFAYGSDIDHETSIMFPDRTFAWAPGLDYPEEDNRAQQEAKQKATYQKVEQVAVWEFVGWDFEFDKTTLAMEIQKGNLRLGEMINNIGLKLGSGHYGQLSPGGNWKVAGEDSSTGLIDPSKPGTYSPVYAKKIVNQTVNVVDEAKYKQYYEQYYHAYVETRRENAFAHIGKKLEGSFVDVADGDKFYLTGGGSVSGKGIKYHFRKRLEKLAPGSVLSYGGLYDDVVIMARIEDGVLVCQKSE